MGEITSAFNGEQFWVDNYFNLMLFETDLLMPEISPPYLLTSFLTVRT